MADLLDFNNKNCPEIEFLEKEILDLERELEEKTTIIDILFSNLIHEIRTPLNGILGFSEMLNSEEVSNKEQKQYAKTVMESGFLLMDLMNDVNDIVKLNSGQINAYNVPFDLNDLFYDLFEIYYVKAGEKNLQFFLNNLISEPFIIHSDPAVLKRILIKLLDNAIKFTAEGWVKIGYDVDGDLIQFFVEDTGIGIDKKLHPNLFERFLSEHVSKSRKIGGAGVDLALCSGLIKTLKGEIWYESKEKEGSIFYFTLKNEK